MLTVAPLLAIPRTGAVSIVKKVFGEMDIWIIATTAGLTTTVAVYFMDISNNKLSYRFNVITITTISFLLSNLGVDQIVKITEPMLSITYPALIVIVIIILLDKGNLSKNIYKGAVTETLLFTSIYCFANFFP